MRYNKNCQDSFKRIKRGFELTQTTITKQANARFVISVPVMCTVLSSDI